MAKNTKKENITEGVKKVTTKKAPVKKKAPAKKPVAKKKTAGLSRREKVLLDPLEASQRSDTEKVDKKKK